ncbi:acyl-CoA dehydrogenase family protein [Herbiconiux sp. CPCC 203407]|uniref:Acyl-CoA dehydrogenase family protein n=1 Tax=Herbiconiux oxytropis TaxID=2970915 RepID=A0AA41XEQ1_9MICO|nr:acyl-CoA dehydrogenase family protein [Herbiconiux oxytropis]MCS5723835.1 acyl-CoA dehydrogenase family protein [Herbiconiux oxytropis]MCS5726617.1 acyl-CoA dehydrogenase family protein [Herbiconiux oxytropis]
MPVSTAPHTAAPRTALHVSDDFEPLMERLDAILPLIAESGAQNDLDGRLTPEVEEALAATGIYGMTVPAELGGYEFSPTQVIKAVERIAAADASTAWVTMALQMETGSTAAYLDPAAARELYAHGLPLHAGQGTKPGTAVPVEGGYRLSGSWSFASGMHQATRLQTAALVRETGESLMITVPAGSATLIDNWDVMGLKATGSIDYDLDDVFVPAEHAWPAATMEPRTGGALYRIGIVNLSGLGHAGWALGVARRMLDEMAELARRKTGSRGATVDSAHFYADYAKAEAKARSARAWLLEVWADNEATLAAGLPLSAEQETLIRLALSNATWMAHEVTMTVYTWAGTAALRSGDLQRYFRDMHAGTQHVTSGPGVVQGCGQMLAGLAPGKRWMFLDLVPA